MELYNFDSEILMTAALDRQAPQQSSSILGKMLFMLMWIKGSPQTLTLIRIGQKVPPPSTSFFLATSRKVNISSPTFLAFSFNSFATHFKISRPYLVKIPNN